MLIVCDTSPITNLIQIDYLEILHDLFGEIVMPEIVFEELCSFENHKEIIQKTSWIRIMPIKDNEAVIYLQMRLDPGEVQAIILAKELKADLLIIDEKKGRKIAEEQGLRIIGLIGVLVQAKRKHHIKKLKPILTILIEDIGFRIGDKLYERILKEVEEN